MNNDIEVEVRVKKDNKKEMIILVALMIMFIVGGICGYVEGTIIARKDCAGKCDEFMEDNCLVFNDDSMQNTYDNIDYGGWNASGMVE